MRKNTSTLVSAHLNKKLNEDKNMAYVYELIDIQSKHLENILQWKINVVVDANCWLMSTQLDRDGLKNRAASPKQQQNLLKP